MIKNIKVYELYGEFNHTIKVKNGNITLILGENGLGKTIILKMIKNLFDNNLYELGNYEFTNFSITFDDDAILEIYKEEKYSKVEYQFYENYTFHISYIKKGKKIQKFQIKFNDILNNYKSYHIRQKNTYKNNYYDNTNYIISKFIPKTMDRIGPDRWFDLESGITYNSLELIDRYSKYLPKELLNDLKINAVPSWFVELTKSVNVKLVETQRLLAKMHSSEKEYKNSVEQYSNELKEIIKNKALEATNLSTRLDRTYTNRLIEKITSSYKNISDNSIGNSLLDLENRRMFLIQVGLLEQDEEVIQPINLNLKYRDNETLKDVLEIYVNDSNEKLSIYDDLSFKLNTLLDIINKRFNYKRFYINKNEGFVFLSNNTNKKIPLANLSSGEQHELVLFYELLFNTPENSLILIDEPEISLHINWQNEFITDLQRVCDLNSIKALIATHSPDIINNNWNLTIEL